MSESRYHGMVGSTLWWCTKLKTKEKHRAYVDDNGNRRWCGHNHTTPEKARDCALVTAKRIEATK